MCCEPHPRRAAAESGRPAQRRRGFALLESLVALLVLSLGALGLLRLSVASMMAARDSDHYVVASIRATELMDTIRVVSGLDDTFWAMSKTQSSSEFTGEKRVWLASVESTLPQGKAAVSCSSGVCGVTLYWTPLAQADEQSAGFSVAKP